MKKAQFFSATAVVAMMMSLASCDPTGYGKEDIAPLGTIVEKHEVSEATASGEGHKRVDNYSIEYVVAGETKCSDNDALTGTTSLTEVEPEIHYYWNDETFVLSAPAKGQEKSSTKDVTSSTTQKELKETTYTRDYVYNGGLFTLRATYSKQGRDFYLTCNDYKKYVEFGYTSEDGPVNFNQSVYDANHKMHDENWVVVAYHMSDKFNANYAKGEERYDNTEEVVVYIAIRKEVYVPIENETWIPENKEITSINCDARTAVSKFTWRKYVNGVATNETSEATQNVNWSVTTPTIADKTVTEFSSSLQSVNQSGWSLVNSMQQCTYTMVTNNNSFGFVIRATNATTSTAPDGKTTTTFKSLTEVISVIDGVVNALEGMTEANGNERKKESVSFTLNVADYCKKSYVASGILLKKKTVEDVITYKPENERFGNVIWIDDYNADVEVKLDWRKYINDVATSEVTPSNGTAKIRVRTPAEQMKDVDEFVSTQGTLSAGSWVNGARTFAPSSNNFVYAYALNVTEAGTSTAPDGTTKASFPSITTVISLSDKGLSPLEDISGAEGYTYKLEKNTIGVSVNGSSKDFEGRGILRKGNGNAMPFVSCSAGSVVRDLQGNFHNILVVGYNDGRAIQFHEGVRYGEATHVTYNGVTALSANNFASAFGWADGFVISSLYRSGTRMWLWNSIENNRIYGTQTGSVDHAAYKVFGYHDAQEIYYFPTFTQNANGTWKAVWTTPKGVQVVDNIPNSLP